MATISVLASLEQVTINAPSGWDVGLTVSFIVYLVLPTNKGLIFSCAYVCQLAQPTVGSWLMYQSTEDIVECLTIGIDKAAFFQ